MKHLGDITKIRGADVPPVNVIIGGSPCQDLSVAGKRAGLEGERSGLFMDQLRIIKEMRLEDETNRRRTGDRIRPRYMVWENVPGAFSSNKGADFGAVLQETARVVVQKVPAVPVPKKGWPTAGCIYGMGDGGGFFSIAWRVFDAQFWGVPQRRRRIALVADFGGLTAPEILFERESVSGDPQTSRTPWKGIARDAENGAERDDSVLGAAGFNGWKSVSGNIQYGEEQCPTIEANMPPNVAYCIQGNCIDRADTAGCNGRGWTEDKSYTLNTIDRPAVVYDARGNGDGKTVPTITGDHENRITDYTAIVLNDQGGDVMDVSYDKAATLRAESHGHSPIVVTEHCFSQDAYDKYTENQVAPTLRQSGGMYGGGIRSNRNSGGGKG